jgi:triosephosphate isomerase (TIM)
VARRGAPGRRDGQHREGRRPLIAGNWKMNLTHLEAIGLVQKLAFSLKEPELEAAEVVVLPPFTALRSVQTLVAGDKLEIGYGGQDLSAHDSGAYTGEVSGAMLASLACTYVVVGHSERRALHGEDDAVVAAKVQAALRHGLVPILCVGEGLDVRKAGQHVPHCTTQLDAALAGLTEDQVRGVDGGGAGSGGIVLAYEPVWAIGTGEVATPEDAQEVCGALRSRLAERFGPETAAAVRILYGGSVKAANTAGILAGPDVDGALVGGASLDGDEFAQICRTAADGS